MSAVSFAEKPSGLIYTSALAIRRVCARFFCGCERLCVAVSLMHEGESVVLVQPLRDKEEDFYGYSNIASYM